MAAPKSSKWSKQKLLSEFDEHFRSKQQRQISLGCINTSDPEIDIWIGCNSGEPKYFTIDRNHCPMSVVGDVILALSQIPYYDRIITFCNAGRYCRYNINLYEWMKPLCASDQFTSLIQIEGYPWGFGSIAQYNLLCEMIAKDKMIAVYLQLSSSIYDDTNNKWLADRSRLLNAIKSSNTLKQINVGSAWRIDCFDRVLAELLSEALEMNLSVISLQRASLFGHNGGGTELGKSGLFEASRVGEFESLFLNWWPSIKERNEQSHAFNKILFGDAKEDGTWNNHQCPHDIARKVLARHFAEIPSLFFEPKGDRCFCAKCHTTRKDKLVYSRGKPPKRYALPIGWVRFGLKTDDAFCAMNKIWSEWHVAFHGTERDVVSKIFQGRLLLLKPGDVAITGDPIKIRGGHIPKPFERFNKHSKKNEMFDPNQIYVSPSIKYSGHPVYAKKFYISHPEDTNRTLSIQIAFQLRIRPGAYDVGQETVGAASTGKKLDGNFSNDELEWYTKENIGILVHGLLFRIRETNVPLKQDTKAKKHIAVDDDDDDEKSGFDPGTILKSISVSKFLGKFFEG